MTNSETRSDMPIDKSIDALLGSDLEVDSDHIEEILAERGFDPEKAVGDLKAALQQRIREYSQEADHPDELDSLQFFVRDISNYQRARSPESVEPKSWIKSILGNENQSQFPAQLARAYRGKKDECLTEGEDKLIQEMEKDLADE